MVGTTGFEPAASPTPRVRATPAPRPENLAVSTNSENYTHSCRLPVLSIRQIEQIDFA
jgi:hypothetical protein